MSGNINYYQLTPWGGGYLPTSLANVHGAGMPDALYNSLLPSVTFTDVTGRSHTVKAVHVNIYYDDDAMINDIVRRTEDRIWFGNQARLARCRIAVQH